MKSNQMMDLQVTNQIGRWNV